MALAAIFICSLFWSAWRASPFEAAANGQQVQSGIDVISIQLDILSLIIAVVGVGLAVMALFGYHSIKDASETAARKEASAKADEVATRVVAEHIEKLEDWKRGFSGQPGRQPVEPGTVEEVRHEEIGNGGDTGSRAGNPQPSE